jgi:hypothetical protein
MRCMNCGQDKRHTNSIMCSDCEERIGREVYLRLLRYWKTLRETLPWPSPLDL